MATINVAVQFEQDVTWPVVWRNAAKYRGIDPLSLDAPGRKQVVGGIMKEKLFDVLSAFIFREAEQSARVTATVDVEKLSGEVS